MHGKTKNPLAAAADLILFFFKIFTFNFVHLCRCVCVCERQLVQCSRTLQQSCSCCLSRMAPNHRRFCAKMEAPSEHVHIAYMFLHVLASIWHAQSVLSDKISASELRGKSIKYALLAGQVALVTRCLVVPAGWLGASAMAEGGLADADNDIDHRVPNHQE